MLTAGLIERWESNASLAAFSDDFLKAMLAFDLTNPVSEKVDGSSRVMVPSWKAALVQERPRLVRDAYVAIARAKLTKGDQNVDGLRELMVDDQDYQVPFKFTGKLNKLTLTIDRPQLTPEDEKRLTEAEKGAADAK